MMDKYRGLFLALAFLTALLAWSGLAVRYFRHGIFDFGMLFAGLAFLLIGLIFWRRRGEGFSRPKE